MFFYSSKYKIPHAQDKKRMTDLVLNESKVIILVTQENEEFEVNEDIVSLSTFIRSMVGNEERQEQEEERGMKKRIPLENVSSCVLEKVIEFMTMFHQTKMNEVPKPLPTNNLSLYVQTEFVTFINSTKLDVLMKLITAANYLDIKPLLELGCTKVACMIKGKSPEVIRETFGMVQDVTDDELKMVREDNVWNENA